VAGDGEDGVRELGGRPEALRAPVGKEEKRGDGVSCWELRQNRSDVEGGEGDGLVRVGGMRGAGEVGQRLAKECVAAAGKGDRDGFVGGEDGRKSGVERGQGCGDDDGRRFG